MSDITIHDNRWIDENDHENPFTYARLYHEHMVGWRESEPPTNRPFLCAIEGQIYIAEYEEIYLSDIDPNNNTPTYWIAERPERNILVSSGLVKYWQELPRPPK